jgi:hypothetical protein
LSDRIKRALERFVELVTQRLDRCALYPARVVTQAADGTLEVQLDDARWPTMTKVPLRTCVPGATIKIASGTRVLVGWEAADPGKPYAALFESGTLLELVVAVQTLMKLGENANNYVALANLVVDELNVLKAAISGAAVVPNDGGAAFKANILAALATWPGSVAATKVKAE